MYSLPSPEVLLGAANSLLFWANGLRSAAVLSPRPRAAAEQKEEGQNYTHVSPDT